MGKLREDKRKFAGVLIPVGFILMLVPFVSELSVHNRSLTITWGTAILTSLVITVIGWRRKEFVAFAILIIAMSTAMITSKTVEEQNREVIQKGTPIEVTLVSKKTSTSRGNRVYEIEIEGKDGTGWRSMMNGEEYEKLQIGDKLKGFEYDGRQLLDIDIKEMKNNEEEIQTIRDKINEVFN
ncbi:hypothetical protein [Bacillus toyonensis]|uniref:hypothetical protein n=1 Tax=Bacillus toyonensis TaxID=155322 RepID=UPI000BF6E858|nr:hypothetical protein [Bacillus toyonensis]PGF05225.1 hypothetical protein COM61_02060 [Bacillus toyonensis]